LSKNVIPRAKILPSIIPEKKNSLRFLLTFRSTILVTKIKKRKAKLENKAGLISRIKNVYRSKKKTLNSFDLCAPSNWGMVF